MASIFPATRFAILATCAAINSTLAQTPQVPTSQLAKPAAIPIEDFVKHAEFESITLSPDGKNMAVIACHRNRANLGIIDLDTRKLNWIINFETYDVYSYDWLGSDRVTLQVVDSLDDATGNIQLRARLAINTDGTGQREMAGYRMLRELTDKPGSVIVLGPGRSNWLSWGSKVPHRVLVTSSSDTYPGGYFVLDTRNNKMERLAERRPWVDEEKMSPMQRMQYAARDGLMIPAMLTLPKSAGGKSAKNLPLVVDIHGGPLAPGAYWGYNETAQFLASRRYAVLQPSFRGSTGYGRKYLEAGYKQ